MSIYIYIFAGRDLHTFRIGEGCDVLIRPRILAIISSKGGRGREEDGTAFVYAKLLRIFQEAIYQGFDVSILLSMQLNLSTRTYPMFEGMSEKYIRIPERNRIFDSIKRRIRQGERGGREKLERIRESRGTVSKKFRIVVRQLQHGSSWPSPKISFHSPVTLSNFCPTSFLRFIFSHILAFTSEISLLTVEINKKKKRKKLINSREIG